MFAVARMSGASAYRRMSVDTGVPDASPHALIGMLLDGAIESVLRARSALVLHDVSTRTGSITRAVRIVDEGLKASLNPGGGEIAANLKALYEYITLRLSEANHLADDRALAEVEQLLTTLRTAWQGIADHPAAK